MANVQLQHGYIKIANNLFEQLFIREFTKKQLRIILLIIRCSYGYNKKYAYIKPLALFQNCKIDRREIKRELLILEETKVIKCDFKNNIFSINKNFDEWIIKNHKNFDEDKFIKLNGNQFKNVSNTLTNPEGKCQSITDNIGGNTLTNSEKCQSYADIEGGNTLTNSDEMSVIHRHGQASNTDEASDNSDVNTSIKDINKDININTLLKEEKKKDLIKDPYYSTEILFFKKTYESEIKLPFRLSPDERTKLLGILNDLILQGENAEKITLDVISNLKAVDFDLENFNKSIHWLLKESNFYRVLDGDFKKNVKKADAVEETWEV